VLVCDKYALNFFVFIRKSWIISFIHENVVDGLL